MSIGIKNQAVVVLDLDDTLYEELAYLKSGFRQIADFIISHRFRDPYEELLSAYFKSGDPLQTLIDRYGYPFTISQLLDIYRHHMPDIRLRVGAENFLDQLKNKRYTAGLMTDGRSVSQRNKIKALGIAHYFSDIIVSEEFGSTKPALRNYQYFMNKYPGRTYCYIGDNFEKDFIAPNKLGWMTIGFEENSHQIHPRSESLGSEYFPQFTISSFDEITLM